jgi:hypothetical protein
MSDLLTLLSVYYECVSLAHDGLLTQTERFACNETYQQAKRLFLDGHLRLPQSILTPEQNTLAYARFKAWEVENAELVRLLKAH